jgi:4-hydroxy-tetrahydrodipicolinate synthase
MIDKRFKGLGVAMVTPFTPAGEVDFAGLRKLIQHLINGGVDYLVVMGTTGENPTLTEYEQRGILDTVLEENNGKLPVVFGMGGNYTAALTHRIATYNLKGVSALLSASPYYNKPNQNGILNHYDAVVSVSELPVIIYNVPGRTGSNISAETTLKLAELPGIIGTKEASGNFAQCMEILKHRPDDFLVISGDDSYTLPFISLGMDGVISVIGNAYPTEFSDLVNKALADDFEGARIGHYALLDLMNTIFEDGSPGGIKVILNELGICGPTLRAPLYPPSDKVIGHLRMQMDSLKQG